MTHPAPEDAFVASSIQSGSRIAQTLLDLVAGVRRPFAVRIDGWGIALDGPGGISAPWSDLADVYVLVAGRRRSVVYELTPQAAQRMGKGGNAAHPGRWHEPARLWAVQPAIPCDYLDRDEHEVLGAVEHFSGGRFPTAERVSVGRGKPDVLRRDFHAGRFDAGRDKGEITDG